MKRLVIVNLVLSLSLVHAALAQEPLASASIVAVDATAFPDLELFLAVTAADGQPVPDLSRSAFSLQEGATAVASFSAAPAEAGLQLVFVLDPNSAFRARNANAVTRLDYIRQALSDFLQSGFFRQELDDVTVLAPEQAVIAHIGSGQELITALQDYTTDFAGAADPFPLLSQALDYASEAAARPATRRAVIFFSNGLAPAAQADSALLADLAARAAAAQVPIFTVFVGPAGAEETAQAVGLQRLAKAAGGERYILSDPESLAPLFERLAGQRSVYRLSYRSSLSTTGQHTLSVQVTLPEGLGQAAGEAVFPLRVEPPMVILSPMPASLSLPPAGAEAASPAELEVAYEVSFPDGHARDWRSVELLVDGERLGIPSPDGGSSLVWPLGAYSTSGDHVLQVRLTDELGLVAVSQPQTVALALEPAMAAAAAVDSGRGMAWLPGLIAGMVGLALLASAGVFWRLRLGGAGRPATAPRSTVPTQPLTRSAPASLRDPETKSAFRLPSLPRRPRVQGKAYLQVLEPGGGGAPRDDVEILAASVRLGRDGAQVDIAFGDTSVSRRHARLVESPAGVFHIYDEGSTSGTWVNFTPIPADGLELRPGDLINLGRVQLRFQQRGLPAAAQIAPQSVAAPTVLATAAPEAVAAPTVPMKPVAAPALGAASSQAAPPAVSRPLSSSPQLTPPDPSSPAAPAVPMQPAAVSGQPEGGGRASPASAGNETSAEPTPPLAADPARQTIAASPGPLPRARV